ncbi:uncharacterized protein Bfra_008300 [Botrytis fragariae]|uniref:Uncharacterized protein n=1 Tax=Botrytis fragariae TaxID=1964551 RepID=A0A8H6ASL2_9HELO|nr:uncharacterized protein Bfra_008300 [Botrytis fragariae]KAF5873023.1 hypothetical protein Bfra_008300 [Botrytis fragariae]
MSEGSRQIPGRSEPYEYSFIPAPAPGTDSEYQGPMQQNIIDTIEQWNYDNSYNDPDFGYTVPLPVNTLESQYASDTSRSSRDPNSLERSSVTEESLLDLLDGSHTIAKPTNITKNHKPQQLPEALKYLAPVPTQTETFHQSVKTQSRHPQQSATDELLPLRQTPPHSRYPEQQVQNAQPISYQSSATHPTTLVGVNDPFLYGEVDVFSQPLEIQLGPVLPPSLSKGKRKQSSSPSPSPDPNSSRPRRVANAKRRREFTSSASQKPSSGSEWWESDASLCWRCRKHNSNHMISGFCDSCIRVSNFNVAPSTQGTRTENLESLVLYLLPSHMEENLRAIPRNTLKTKTWRMFSAERAEKAFDHDFDNTVFRDHFVLAQEQARSTGVFDEKYSDLMAIAQTYQESILQPNKSLEASCRILIECCELYKCFITTTMPPAPIPVLNLLEKIRTTRSTMRRAFKEYQSLALAPSDFRSRRDWLPSFLSACSLAISAVVFIDMMVAVPSPYKERIWGVAWQERITQIRHGGYGMMLEVLRANTKNINPLELSCWDQDFGMDTNFQVLNNAHDPFAGNQYMNAQYSTGYTIDPSSNSQFYYGLATPTTQDFAPDILYANLDYDQAYYDNWQQMQLRMQQQAKAEEERRILLGDTSPEALQGMMAVKSWQMRNFEHLKLGENIFKKDLYRQATINPIAGLWRIFDMK